VLISPQDIDLWAETMKELLRDPAQLTELQAKGYARAETFTWTRTAAETYRVYKDVVR
jgi:glycosyltransferase involved in cell wall biosynthesis